MIDLPPPSVHVPDLRGLTVAEASAQLRTAGLRPESGLRLEWRDGRFRPAAAGRVASQSIKPGARVSRGVTVTVGTTGPKLDVETFGRIGFERGRIALGDLSRACVRYDHATIGPTRNGARPITLWGMRVKGCAPARRVELQPPAGWTIHTNAVPVVAPSRPDPKRTADPRRAPREGMMLMPDRRSVLVQFSRDACHGVMKASVTVRSRTITPRVTLGARPGYKGVCIARLDHDSVLIRLPRPAPLGVKFS
ncbi:PASTA domain-containing protein [Solirubrobacter sp. CPCC 204708]|uniref:PASTA domain-containing protein n=1 Tax=Solirubrobacter deserti TaxID=2282478 RepID=A0ABT4RBR5_9ACTN|nr:PASTA domain-containing protein [Solirubrobacter deserti]MBE2317129.1 PASTA domain-containing protein [Solirubrobacter deserti]MDA0135978.1 PASTA domain-containing protein [Solirubrobacter deserti]